MKLRRLPLAELLAWDLVPYRELAGSGAAVMVGHLDVPGLTDGVPASRSAAAIVSKSPLPNPRWA